MLSISEGILKVRSGNLLLAINLLSVLLIILIALLPSNVLRIVLGLPFILFLPGYTLMAAIFPKRNELNNTERMTLSFGLSIAVAPLLCLILNYTPWGIGLYPILAAVAIFIFVTSVIAWYRLRKISKDEFVSTKIRIDFPQWKTISIWNRALSIALVVLILGSIGTLAYAIVTPKQGEKFTEFYVLGPNGQAEGYLTELSMGETGEVILGIVNHEGEDNLVYNVELFIDGEVKQTVGPLTLADEEKWEEEVNFIPDKVGENQKVEFNLYKQGEDTPCKVLYLWFDVQDAGQL